LRIIPLFTGSDEYSYRLVVQLTKRLSSSSIGTHFYLVTHLSKKCSYLRITQEGWLREIPSDMPLRQRYLLCLKVQGNPPDLFAISLQPLFSQLSSKSYHSKSTPGQLMPNFCTFGQELPLWKGVYCGSVSVKISGPGQVMALLAANFMP
jgi:hypothetical protein